MYVAVVVTPYPVWHKQALENDDRMSRLLNVLGAFAAFCRRSIWKISMSSASLASRGTSDTVAGTAVMVVVVVVTGVVRTRTVCVSTSVRRIYVVVLCPSQHDLCRGTQCHISMYG